jgi:DNA polymerase
MKASVNYASVKKVATMIACAGPFDNRIRGMLNHHGTGPGRWTASLVQFQNMKRPTIDNTEGAYKAICEGVSRDMLDLCYGPPLEVISSCIRHFVQDGDRMLNDVDYSAIQARVVAWLAGQEDALEEYRQGVERYKRMASFIYGIPEDQVNKFPQRLVGKEAILGCGFGLGPAKFRVTVKKRGYILPLGLEETAVAMWRAKNKKIVSFWYDTERAAKRAIVHKGKAFAVGKITFLCRDVEGFPFLLLQLPSKRKLAYPKPKIIADRITIFGKIGQSQQWGDVSIWGGTLVENATMGVEADIMFHGLHKAEAADYETFTVIHDQALAYHKPGQTPEEFVELLTDMPSWADGLPIAAEGSLVPFYKKD